MPRTPFRILALDVDGTLLDRDGTLRPRTIEAVSRAAACGIKPVLCTGRRHRRTLPIAESLGIQNPLVCNSGALVKELSGHRTLWRADLDEALLRTILKVFQELDEPAVSFTDRSPDHLDFVVQQAPTGRAHFDDYLEQNRSHAEIRPGWADRPGHGHFHLCAIGTRTAMLEFEARIHEVAPGRVRTFVQKSQRYSGTMCEILRHDASKWSALLHLANLWGVNPSEICAVGDDSNDIPMLQGAGLGVAMGHAGPEVIEAADFVTGSDDEDGVAMLIEEFLLGNAPIHGVKGSR